MPDPRNFAMKKRAYENPANVDLNFINYRDVTDALSDSEERVMNNEAKVLFPPRQVKFRCSAPVAIDAPNQVSCGFKRLVKNFEKMVHR